MTKNNIIKSVWQKVTGALAALMTVSMLMLPVAAAAVPVVDQADLFTPDQEQEITAIINKSKEDTGMDMAVVTTEDTQEKQSWLYADDFYDQNGYGDDGVLLLLDMENRRIEISTKGKGIAYVTDARIEHILEKLVPDMKEENYVKVAHTFVDMTTDYLLDPPAEALHGMESFVHGIKDHWYLLVFIPLAGGLIAIWIVYMRYRSKPEKMDYDFRSQGSLNLRNQSTRLIRTWVTQRAVPKDDGSGSSGGGGSSTRSSSSGDTHGGGGADF